MGRSFDYERAWWEVAKPAYEALPQDVRDLFADMARMSEGVGQSADLSMPWPDEASEYHGVRQRFGKIPAEWLAQAARVVYFLGHWYPASGKPEVPGRAHGATWKFAHYADQELRARLCVPDHGSRTPSGVSLAIHEGVIRLCYSSDDSWQWEEVAEATPEGLARAQGMIPSVSGFQQIDRRKRSERDGVAWREFEALKVAVHGTVFPAWPGLVHGADLYMDDESVIAARRAAYLTPAERAAKDERARAAIVAQCAEKVADCTRERDGRLWLFDHGHAAFLENVIYYRHIDRWAFGWREALSADEASANLEWISEFPYAYRLVRAAGGPLEGGGA